MYALALVQSPRLRYNCMAAPASAVLAAGMQRLVAAAPRPLRYDDWLCTLGAWLDGQLLAVASIYREPQLGPPKRGIYRFAELAVQARDANMDAAEVLIARCGAHVVRAGGLTL